MFCKAGVYTYGLLSLAFIAVNVFTLSNLPPWIDEVMMLDTSYNMAVHGSWETTAWYRVAGQYPFSTYPPLYQMVATAWIWLFGRSMVAVRSLNLLLMFAMGGMCLNLMKRHGLKLTAWTVALFTVLLWGTSEMSWIYRNGRSDMLCALMCVLTVLAIDNYCRRKYPPTLARKFVNNKLIQLSQVNKNHGFRGLEGLFLLVFDFCWMMMLKHRFRTVQKTRTATSVAVIL